MLSLLRSLVYNQKASSYLVASIALHALILFLFPLTDSPIEQPKIEIEFKERKKESAPLGQDAKNQNSKSTDSHKPIARKRNSKKIHIGKGGLNWEKIVPNMQGYTAGAGRDFGHKENTSGWSDNDWGNRGFDLAQIENYLTYEKLFEHIRGMLNYPPGLGRRKISGMVTARLVFNDDQKCNWQRSFVKANSPYLKVYIGSQLRKLCELIESDGQTLKIPKKTYIDMTFAFVITELPETEADQQAQEGILGNVLRFYRSYPQSMMEYRLGPIRGYFGLPAIALDSEWVFEKWDLWVNKYDIMDRYKEKD